MPDNTFHDVTVTFKKKNLDDKIAFLSDLL